MAVILIVGATGTIGKHVASQLLTRNCNMDTATASLSQKHVIRCGLRDVKSTKAMSLERRGADCVRFGYDDESSWSDAFRGVERLFILFPFFTFDFELILCIRAAKEAGIKTVVLLSTQSSHKPKDTKHRIKQQIPVCDSVVAGAGFDHYTIVCPTLLREHFPTYQGSNRRGKDRRGAVHAATPYVAGEEVAAVCVTALLRPTSHTGKSYLVTSSEAISGKLDIKRLATYLPNAEATLCIVSKR